MDKEQLIEKIYKAFEGVQLEDGVGLWEGQGLDDYASPQECAKLIERDESKDWRRIPVIDLYKCSSSLSFFDAKGMRFHLPILLLLDIDVFESEEDALHNNGDIEHCFAPDIYYKLVDDLESDYSIEQFSALNNEQIQVILDYFSYKMQERKAHYLEYDVTPEAAEALCEDILEVMDSWKRKLK